MYSVAFVIHARVLLQVSEVVTKETSLKIGFIFLPRHSMLIGTALTLHIGPAIILVVFGLIFAVLAAFAIYPIYSASFVWLWFFLSSQGWQAIGKALGLDKARWIHK